MLTNQLEVKKILDLALVSDIVTLIAVHAEHLFGSSDHEIVYLTINWPIPKINKAVRCKVYLYSKAEYDSFNQGLANIALDALLCTNDIEMNWGRFQIIYRTLLDKYIPAKYIKRKDKAPWTRYKSVEKAKNDKKTI